MTFAVSLPERVIEEQAGGDPASAAQLREELQSLIGGDLFRTVPCSEEAMALKRELQARDLRHKRADARSRRPLSFSSDKILPWPGQDRRNRTASLRSASVNSSASTPTPMKVQPAST